MFSFICHVDLINVEVLKKCRRGVRVINCARGGIVDEAALLEALQSGHCAGAGLDVFEQVVYHDMIIDHHYQIYISCYLLHSVALLQIQ